MIVPSRRAEPSRASAELSGGWRRVGPIRSGRDDEDIAVNQEGKRVMRSRITSLLCLVATWAVAGTASGQDTGAKSNGNWETATIWTGGAVPGSSNNVYIGSTHPTGAAATATVTLTANEAAANV
jgi:hypothetical protein